VLIFIWFVSPSLLSLKIPLLILIWVCSQSYPHWLSNSWQGELSSALRIISNTNSWHSACSKFIIFRFRLFTPPLGDFQVARGKLRWTNRWKVVRPCPRAESWHECGGSACSHPMATPLSRITSYCRQKQTCEDSLHVGVRWTSLVFRKWDI
jgi:hypothetical protein